MNHNDNEVYDMINSKHIWLSAYKFQSPSVEIFLKRNREGLMVFDIYSEFLGIVWMKVN